MVKGIAKKVLISVFLLFLFSLSRQAIMHAADTSSSQGMKLVAEVAELPDEAIDNLHLIIMLRLITILQQHKLSYHNYPTQPFGALEVWFDKLVEGGELTDTYRKVFSYTMPRARNCATPSQEGYCYGSTGEKAVIIMRLKAKVAEKGCERGEAFILWTSSPDSLKKVCYTQLESF